MVEETDEIIKEKYPKKVYFDIETESNVNFDEFERLHKMKVDLENMSEEDKQKMRDIMNDPMKMYRLTHGGKKNE